MKVVVTHTDLRIYWPARLDALQRALKSRGDELYIVEIAGAGSPHAFAAKRRTADIEHHPAISLRRHGPDAPLPAAPAEAASQAAGYADGEAPRNWICLFPDARMEDIPAADASRMLLKKLNELDPDVVMSSSFAYPSGAAAIRWARSYHKAVVIFDDAKPTDVVRSGIVNSIKRRIFGQIDAMLCPAEPWRKAMGFWGLRPEQIFLGVDVVDNAFWAEQPKTAPGSNLIAGSDAATAPRPALTPDAEQPPFLLAVGRQIEAKNLLFLLRAYARYSKDQSAALPLVMVGEGPQRENIQRLIEELKIDKVTLIPFVSPWELRGIYHRAAALVLPSKSETWGLVVNEAMASGLPVLVSSACGCSEVLIKDESNGYVFPPADEEKLTDVLRRFTALSRDERKAMGSASLRVISDWGLDRFVDGSTQAIDYAFMHRKECRSLITRLFLRRWKGRYRPV